MNQQSLTNRTGIELSSQTNLNSPAKGDQVVVAWQDTFSCDGEYNSLENALTEFDQGNQVTIGFFITEVDGKVMLCREMSTDEGAGDYYRDLYVIPRGMIKKITILS